MGDADLARRAWRGLALFLLAMLVLLFLTAGSLRYWQGWLYLALFGGAVSAITWYLQEHDPELLRRRLGARPGAEKEPRQKVLQAIAQLAFIALLIVPGLAYRFHRSPIPLPLALLGNLLVILGLWIVFLAFKANSYSSAIIEISPGQPVISTGPYRLVRHPMYAGTLLMLFGTALALGSYWGLVPFVLLLIVIVLRLLDEERVLSRDLPGYQEYLGKVRYRLVPHAW